MYIYIYIYTLDSTFCKGGCSGDRVQCLHDVVHWFYYVMLPQSTAPPIHCTALCRVSIDAGAKGFVRAIKRRPSERKTSDKQNPTARNRETMLVLLLLVLSLMLLLLLFDFLLMFLLLLLLPSPEIEKRWLCPPAPLQIVSITITSIIIHIITITTTTTIIIIIIIIIIFVISSLLLVPPQRKDGSARRPPRPGGGAPAPPRRAEPPYYTHIVAYIHTCSDIRTYNVSVTYIHTYIHIDIFQLNSPPTTSCYIMLRYKHWCHC